MSEKAELTAMASWDLGEIEVPDKLRLAEKVSLLLDAQTEVWRLNSEIVELVRKTCPEIIKELEEERKMKRVLILDDDADWLESIGQVARREGAEVTVCASLEEAYRAIDEMIASRKLPDAIFSDALARDPNIGVVTEYHMAGKLFLYIRKATGKDPGNFYMITSNISREDKTEASRLGIPVISKLGAIREEVAQILRDLDVDKQREEREMIEAATSDERFEPIKPFSFMQIAGIFAMWFFSFIGGGALLCISSIWRDNVSAKDLLLFGANLGLVFIAAGCISVLLSREWKDTACMLAQMRHEGHGNQFFRFVLLRVRQIVRKSLHMAIAFILSGQAAWLIGHMINGELADEFARGFIFPSSFMFAGLAMFSAGYAPIGVHGAMYIFCLGMQKDLKSPPS